MSVNVSIQTSKFSSADNELILELLQSICLIMLMFGFLNENDTHTHTINDFNS